MGATQCAPDACKPPPIVCCVAGPKAEYRGLPMTEDHPEERVVLEGVPIFTEVVVAEESTYTIILDKSIEKNLGLNVDHTVEVDCLPILRITGGLAAKWNVANPCDRIMVGDMIIEVNGCAGDVVTLLERCRCDQLLRMVVKRGRTCGRNF